jgi:3-hydroxyisobutyrate dehydrogenase
VSFIYINMSKQSDDMKTKIGFIGLGKMGILMSQRLLGEGYPLSVYNRTKGKEEILVAGGAVAASSPKTMMGLCDIILLMVSDDMATRDIFTGNEGLLSSEIGGKIIINMSTVSAEISREMADLCLLQKNHYLDAPVSGSLKQAENGELVIMAGGEEDVFNKVKPIFGILGKLSLRVGNTGAGNMAKLAVNAFLGIMTLGLSESIVYAKRNGIDTHDLLNIINSGAMGNAYVKIKGDAILQEKFLPAFTLKHIVKDLRLASESGFQSPLGKTALETFQKAESEFGEEDIISIVKYISR